MAEFGLFCFSQKYGIIPLHICQTNHFEVTNIRKLITFALALFLAFGLILSPQRVSAAQMDSHVGAVTTVSGGLNVRKSASTGSAILASLNKGSYVTLISKSGSWWKVEYAQNKYGYCHADFITPVEGKPAQVVTPDRNVLNVRSGPGTSYSRIATVNHGDIVMVRSTAKGWSRILYHGTKLGYVSSQFLPGVGNSNPGSGLSSISLAVPSMKQTDRRWSSYPLGTTGGTIGTIGCATTGIAIMESYRTGTTIYPNEMAKKLTYTSGGSVYWPSHYTVVTSKTGYLERIYELLQQGKPVLIGAKTNAGGQHWVVVKGFSGSSLTASNFLIEDPGTSTRTNLQQFFNAYPNFYKYFYY